MTPSGKSWEELKRIRTCNVFFVKQKVYVVSSSRTVPGFDIDSEPIFEIDRGSPPKDLGDAVLAALDAFKLDVQAPDPRVGLQSPLLKRAGFRSWKALEKDALHVTVHLDRSVFATPTARDKQRGGYLHRPDLACECRAEAHDIGKTLLQALSLCT